MWQKWKPSYINTYYNKRIITTVYYLFNVCKFVGLRFQLSNYLYKHHNVCIISICLYLVILFMFQKIFCKNHNIVLRKHKENVCFKNAIRNYCSIAVLSVATLVKLRINKNIEKKFSNLLGSQDVMLTLVHP